METDDSVISSKDGRASSMDLQSDVSKHTRGVRLISKDV